MDIRGGAPASATRKSRPAGAHVSAAFGFADRSALSIRGCLPSHGQGRLTPLHSPTLEPGLLCGALWWSRFVVAAGDNRRDTRFSRPLFPLRAPEGTFVASVGFDQHFANTWEPKSRQGISLKLHESRLRIGCKSKRNDSGRGIWGDDLELTFMGVPRRMVGDQLHNCGPLDATLDPTGKRRVSISSPAAGDS